MKILLVNPNTDRDATEIIRGEAVRTASPGTEIIAQTVPTGPIVVVTPDDTARQGPVVIDVMRRHMPGIDAAITSAYSDPGLLDAQRLGIPVLGIGQSSMLEAARLGRRMVILTGNPSNAGLYRACAERYGVADRLANIRFLSSGTPDAAALYAAIRDPELLLAKVVDAARLAIELDGADVAIVAGGPLAGTARRAQSSLPIPILDCVGCAVTRMERWLSTGSPN